MWCYSAQPEAVGSAKVTHVMCNDEIAGRLDSKLEDVIVLRVAEKRPPQEEDLSMSRDPAYIVQNVINISMAQTDLARHALGRVFVLGDQGNGNVDLESSSPD